MKKTLAFLFVTCLLSTSYAQSLPDAPRKIDFAGLTVRLDADAQKAVQDEIKFLLVPDSKMLQEKIERVQWYFPIIEAILEEEEVPEDFKYLAVVESSLMPDVISSSNAVGFWQMKAETATDLGLQINKDVDERKNIYASTKAAALYLKRNNLIYKNWISTLYSYYLGATGVSKLVPSEWAYASEVKLDGKTDRYIIKTIAHRIAFEYRLNRLREPSNAFVEYKNSKGKSLTQIATDLSLELNDLKKYNAWLLANNIPSDKDYSVAILSPTENIEKLQTKIKTGATATAVKSDVGFPVLKKITIVTSSPFEPIFYEINEKKGILAQAGDDVAALAQKGKIKISKFLDINDLTDKDLLKEGRVYYLEKKDKHAKVPYHTVTDDQTLWDVSQMYGITMYRLMDYNRMNAIQRLQAGRILWLQKRRPKDQPIEYVIDKDKETTPVKEDLPIIEKYDNKESKKDETKKDDTKTTTEKDPDAREVETPTTKPAETPKKGPIVVLEEEAPKPTPVEEKPKVKETPKVETKPTTTTKTPDPEVIVLKDNGKELTPEPAKTTPTTTPAPATSKPVINTPAATKVHLVVAGETLYSIARTYNVPPKELAAWNNVTIEEKVKVGQQLTVVAPKTAPVVAETPKTETKSTTTPAKVEAKPAAVPAKVEPKATTQTHVVAKGETLYSIAKKYGATMKDIKSWNGMADENVKLGQKIIVKK
jgi:membrane-bound lytic murein transglycosylase D